MVGKNKVFGPKCEPTRRFLMPVPVPTENGKGEADAATGY